MNETIVVEQGVDRTIRVRQATMEDFERLGRFYAEAYPGKERWKYPERWTWEYVDNPFRPDDRPPVWIAEQGDRIIGHTAAMYVPCKVGDETVTAAWSVDTVVLPQYRGMGVGRRLQQANQGAHDLFMSLAMSPANRAIKEKIGERRMGPMTQHIRVTHVDERSIIRTVERTVSKRLGERAGGAARAAMTWTRADRAAAHLLESRLRPHPRPGAGQRAVEPFTFDEVTDWSDTRMDELWRQVRQRYDFAVERSGEYLRWKYGAQPWVKYRAVLARHEQDVAGLLVYRLTAPPEPPMGAIVELIAANGTVEEYRAMARHAAETMELRGAVAVVAGASEDAQRQALAEAGFIEYDRQDPMVGGRPDLTARAVASKHVLLSMGDQDLDQYPYLAMPSALRLATGMGLRRGEREKWSRAA